MDIVSVEGRCFYRSKIEAARKESCFVVPSAFRNASQNMTH